jgi:hypothetical protein
MVKKGEIIMFFWESDEHTIQLVEGLVRYIHPSGFVAVTSDLSAGIEHYIRTKNGNVYLRVPVANVIAAKAGTPQPQWLKPLI